MCVCVLNGEVHALSLSLSLTHTEEYEREQRGVFSLVASQKHYITEINNSIDAHMHNRPALARSLLVSSSDHTCISFTLTPTNTQSLIFTRRHHRHCLHLSSSSFSSFSPHPSSAPHQDQGSSHAFLSFSSPSSPSSPSSSS